MNHPAFILANSNLTYDPAQPNLCTDEPEICYGLKQPAPRPPRPTRRRAAGFGGCGLPGLFGKPATSTLVAKAAAKVFTKQVPSTEDLPPKKEPRRERLEIYGLKAKIAELKARIDELERERVRAEAAGAADRAKASDERSRADAARRQIAAELERLERLVMAALLEADVAASIALDGERDLRVSAAAWLAGSVAAAAAAALIPLSAELRVIGFGVAGGCLAIAISKLLAPARRVVKKNEAGVGGVLA